MHQPIQTRMERKVLAHWYVVRSEMTRWTVARHFSQRVLVLLLSGLRGRLLTQKVSSLVIIELLFLNCLCNTGSIQVCPLLEPEFDNPRILKVHKGNCGSGMAV